MALDEAENLLDTARYALNNSVYTLLERSPAAPKSRPNLLLSGKEKNLFERKIYLNFLVVIRSSREAPNES